MSLLVTKRVNVGKVHEKGSNSDQMVKEGERVTHVAIVAVDSNVVRTIMQLIMYAS